MSLAYDIIIAGGGCAGLSLAYYLNRSSLKNKRILILDTEPKTQNDKTWCFWTEKDLPFVCAKQTFWKEMEFMSDQVTLTQGLDTLRYVFVNSLAFYQEIKEELEQNPNVEFRYEKILRIDSYDEYSEVETTLGTYHAPWTFNSIVFPQVKDPQRNFYLNQHFGGWFIKTQEPTFNPQRMRLMDFRVPQQDEARFVYILPFNEREALVEYTVFSEDKWLPEAYDQEIQHYLKEYIQVSDFEITHREMGCIPMTNHSFARTQGPRVVNLGTAAGLTKPTTGYTFLNIQRDAQAIAREMERSGQPLYRRQTQKRFAFYDDLLLYIIRNHGGQTRRIFSYLFKRNPFQTILRFLDERTSLIEELYIFARLPWGPFLNAIWQYKVLGKTGSQLSTYTKPSKTSVPTQPMKS